MLAITVSRNGGPEVLELADVPDPQPGPGQLLVDVAAAGVNFRDIYEREGGYGRPAPFVAGIEGAGTVVAVGPEVTEYAPGDRVGWVNAPGSYAERALVEASRAVPIPPPVELELAAALLLQGLTAHYLCTSTYAVQAGDTVLVHAGAGGVGLLLTQMVRRRGGRVIATTSTDAKAEVAKAAGADWVVDYQGFAGRARELTGGEGVAAVYDSVGKATVDQSLDALRRRGMLVVYGSSSGPAPLIDTARLGAGGSLFVTRPTLVDYTATRDELLWRASDVLGWAAEGALDVRIGGRYALAEARQAQEDLQSRRTTGKLVLLP